MLPLLQIGGLLSLLLGLFHCLFHRIFGWDEAFARLSPRDAHVLYTIHLFLIPFFFFFAYAAFFHTAELAGGSYLGLALSTFYAVFWLLRGVWQITYLRPPAQSRLTKFVFLHRVLAVVFFVMGLVFVLPLASRHLHF